jgi:hypothetical protein
VPNVLKSGGLNFLEPSGPVNTCKGITLTFCINTYKQKSKENQAKTLISGRVFRFENPSFPVILSMSFGKDKAGLVLSRKGVGGKFTTYVHSCAGFVKFDSSKEYFEVLFEYRLQNLQ